MLSRVKVYAFAHDGTTNLLEGFNSQLKRALHNYDGLNEANKKKFIDGFINTKKVGWNNQPTKCPLLKPMRFSAYQMSVSPYFVYLGLRGKIWSRWVGAVPMCPPVSPHKGAFIVKFPAHNAYIFVMETPLRRRLGGHTGTAPTHFA